MELKGKTFTIGADPEVFMGKNGVFVSAHDAIPGDKLNPYIVDRGAVQVDGMALEFNIDPAESLEDFHNNLDTVQSILKTMIGDHEFLSEVSVNFDEKFLETVPAKNRMLGCSSDFNGWTLDENVPPSAATLMRTVGGHVHVGGFFTDRPFAPSHYNQCARLARCMDYTLGAFSVLWDTDDKRRSMYGQAGCFRPKPYGMEYRTLSNKWIFSKKLVSFVYEATERAIDMAFNSDFEPPEIVRDIINKSDRKSEFFSGFDKSILEA